MSRGRATGRRLSLRTVKVALASALLLCAAAAGATGASAAARDDGVRSLVSAMTLDEKLSPGPGRAAVSDGEQHPRAVRGPQLRDLQRGSARLGEDRRRGDHGHPEPGPDRDDQALCREQPGAGPPAGHVNVDDQTLHEIELAGFESAVKAGTGAIMCSYNKVNGEPGCGSEPLLNEILRGQWRFRGWVMSDWGATHSTDAILKGLDQEMPGGTFLGDPLKAAIENGTIPTSALDRSVTRILRQMRRFGLLRCASASGAVQGCSLPPRGLRRGGR
jgi:hypothetical protein